MEFVEQLEKGMDDRVPIKIVSVSEIAPNKIFGAGVTWKPLTPLPETLKELNKGAIFRLPTFDLSEKLNVAKRNFDETMDEPPFIGLYEQDVLNRFKQKCFDPRTKNFKRKG